MQLSRHERLNTRAGMITIDVSNTLFTLFPAEEELFQEGSLKPPDQSKTTTFDPQPGRVS